MKDEVFILFGLNTVKKPLLTIFYLALFCQYVVSQDVDKRYVMAYKEMTSMLEGITDLSIKRAVFLSEWEMMAHLMVVF